MSGKVQIVDDVPQLTAHVVPCKIHYTGEANTHEYFTPSKEKVGEDDICYVRGCKFIGRKAQTEGYTGFVMNKSEALAPADDDTQEPKIVNNYVSVAKFNDLHVYGHDRNPKLTDQYLMTKEWIELTNIIHE